MRWVPIDKSTFGLNNIQWDEMERRLAVVGRDVELVRLLKKKNEKMFALLRHTDYFLNSVLRHGRREVVQMLIEEMRARPGPSSLEIVATSGSVETLEYLVQFVPVVSDKPLAVAARNSHLSLVKYLLAIAPRQVGTDALEAAATSGNLEIVQAIYQANPSALCQHTLSAAILFGHLHIFRHLVEIDSTLVPADILDSAATYGNLDNVKYLADTYSSLYVAPKSLDTQKVAENPELLKLLLPKVQLPNNGYLTEKRLLSMALDKAVFIGSLKTVEYLVSECGAIGSSGNIEDASVKGYLEIIQYLCSLSTVPELTDTAFSHACNHGRVQIIRHFISNGTTVHQRADQGLFSAIMTSSHPLAIKELIQYDTIKSMKTCYFVVMTLDMQVFLALDKAGYPTRDKSVLFKAIAYGNLEVVEYLLAANSEVQEEYPPIRNMMLCAINNGQVAVASFLHTMSITNNDDTIKGETIIELIEDSAKHGHLAMIRWLHTTYPSQQCTTPTALDNAIRKRHHHIIHYLINNNIATQFTLANVHNAIKFGNLGTVSLLLDVCEQINHLSLPEFALEHQLLDSAVNCSPEIFRFLLSRITYSHKQLSRISLPQHLCNNFLNFHLQYRRYDSVNLYGNSLILNNTIFDGCTSINRNGGAINSIGFPVNVYNSRFTNCLTNKNGCAIYSSSSVLFYNSYATGCSAKLNGGAIYSHNYVEVLTGRLSENSANQKGGAIFNKVTGVAVAESVLP
eukprot:gene18394-22013_t